jgi:hypothetical protein
VTTGQEESGPTVTGRYLHLVRRRVCDQRFASSPRTDASIDTWVERLSEAGVPATRVYGLEEAVNSDVARERRTFQECDRVPHVRLPWLVDGEPLGSPSPALGQHTAKCCVTSVCPMNASRRHRGRRRAPGLNNYSARRRCIGIAASPASSSGRRFISMRVSPRRRDPGFRRDDDDSP